ncbi:MAG: hypothetical protein IPM29_28365 [Planctomycetes bacterium]|nr:hypothetical protein [Planctomycetota bacterium]
MISNTGTEQAPRLHDRRATVRESTRPHSDAPPARLDPDILEQIVEAVLRRVAERARATARVVEYRSD